MTLVSRVKSLEREGSGPRTIVVFRAHGDRRPIEELIAERGYAPEKATDMVVIMQTIYEE